MSVHLHCLALAACVLCILVVLGDIQFWGYFIWDTYSTSSESGSIRGHPFMTSMRVVRLWWTHADGGGGVSSMWTSTQKIFKLEPLTSFCLLLMQRNWRFLDKNLDGIKSGNFSSI